MAARYQRVTDAQRSQVASQVGELIWDSVAGNDEQTALVVRRGSLAVVLAAVEDCIAGHHSGSRPAAELLAALADLRAALPPAAAAPRTANETKTEPRAWAAEAADRAVHMPGSAQRRSANQWMLKLARLAIVCGRHLARHRRSGGSHVALVWVERASACDQCPADAGVRSPAGGGLKGWAPRHARGGLPVAVNRLAVGWALLLVPLHCSVRVTFGPTLV
jgi:hypothetical protein